MEKDKFVSWGTHQLHVSFHFILLLVFLINGSWMTTWWRWVSEPTDMLTLSKTVLVLQLCAEPALGNNQLSLPDTSDVEIMPNSKGEHSNQKTLRPHKGGISNSRQRWQLTPSLFHSTGAPILLENRRPYLMRDCLLVSVLCWWIAITTPGNTQGVGSLLSSTGPKPEP